jgi:hypothetical protein
MEYYRLFIEKLIPNLSLQGLYEQLYLFRYPKHVVEKLIYQAICDRIEVLRRRETNTTLWN